MRIPDSQKQEYEKLGLKWCPKCLQAHPLDDFHLTNKGVRYHYCRKYLKELTARNAKRRFAEQTIHIKPEDVETFHPMGKNISRYESRALAELGLKWCPRCQTAKPFDVFRTLYAKPSFHCRECDRKLSREFAVKYPHQIQKSNRSDRKKEWSKLYRKRPEYADRYNEYQRKRYAKNPLIKVRSCLAQATRKVFGYRGGLHTMQIIGVQSCEEFISLMSSKTQNPNWIKDGYHLDHIWQFNWFVDFLKEHRDNTEIFQKALSVIHCHKNLRPLSPSDNIARLGNDFSPLAASDLPMY